MIRVNLSISAFYSPSLVARNLFYNWVTYRESILLYQRETIFINKFKKNSYLVIFPYFTPYRFLSLSSTSINSLYPLPRCNSFFLYNSHFYAMLLKWFKKWSKKINLYFWCFEIKLKFKKEVIKIIVLKQLKKNRRHCRSRRRKDNTAAGGVRVREVDHRNRRPNRRTRIIKKVRREEKRKFMFVYVKFEFYVHFYYYH